MRIMEGRGCKGRGGGGRRGAGEVEFTALRVGGLLTA
jgi:hypothetical protein